MKKGKEKGESYKEEMEIKGCESCHMPQKLTVNGIYLFIQMKAKLNQKNEHFMLMYISYY